eukprot:TRINITY_DN1239_c0_g1_i1.p1 TRINITY_DN1239_c0_g1~~TRINITY_DN1239_c0_g1_i1.p1  ORF type:complete len:965 (-),score=254.06 TRINITY_DN1239_c0_g1_i1:306-3176(-)
MEIAAVFERTLSIDKGVRQAAESQLRSLRIQPQFGIQLLGLVSTAGIPDPVRVAAAVHFKNLVREHWDEREDDHLSDADKAGIKAAVVDVMLNVRIRAVQETLSDAIARICSCDFPAKWPDLVPSLVARLVAQDLQVVHGILFTSHSVFKKYRKLIELTTELKDEILAVIAAIGEPLLQLSKVTHRGIQEQSSKAGLEQLFDVLNLVINIFFDLNCLDIAPFFENSMQQFMGLFLDLLGYNNPLLVDEDEDEEPDKITVNKALVLQCITLYLEKFDEDFQPYVQGFVTAVWELLQTLTKKPKHDQLNIAAMEFMTAITKTIHHAILADPEKQRVICEKIIIPSIELRDSDVEMFHNDPTEYIQRDIEGSDSDTRRKSAVQLIAGLSRNYEATVSSTFQQYIGYLLQESGTASSKWLLKDTAYYLITALAARGGTTQRGATRINELVNVGQFLQEHVLPELTSGSENPGAVPYPILKADAIKFISTFRFQIPKEQYVALLTLLAAWLPHPSEVVHTYAAVAIERILTVRDGSVLRLQKDDWRGVAGPMLQKLFEVLARATRENDHVMKAVMRVVSLGQEHIGGYVSSIIPLLTGILEKIAKNPANPTFNHYVFECISSLVRFNPAQAPAIEQSVLRPFMEILQNTPEFMPYVFQIFAQFLRTCPEVNPAYLPMFPHFINPALYEARGNIPALVMLLRACLHRLAPQIAASGQLQGVLGVFQCLVGSKTFDHEGFNLLNSILEDTPRERLAEYLRTVFYLLFQRLSGPTRTTKFVRCLICFFSLVCVKYGPDALLEAIDQVQPGLWKQVVPNVWLREVQKVTGTLERKMCAVALTKLLCESQVLVATASDVWTQAVVSVVKMFEFGEEPDADSDYYSKRHIISEEQLKDQDDRTNAFCPLASAQRPEDDPCKDVASDRAFFAQSFQRLLQGPCAQQCTAMLQQLPGDVQQRLQGLIRG